jgi:hypothetical protein
MDEKHSTKVHLAPLLRAALASRQPGEDLDEAILRALKAAHPEHAVSLLAMATETIDMEMKLTHESREQVVQRLAAADPGPEVTVMTFGAGPLHMNFESMVFVGRAGDKIYRSLDEMPEDLRRAVEAALPPDKRHLLLTAGSEVPPALAPQVRRAIEDELGRGEKVRIVRGAGATARTGCSTALLIALWRLVWR